MKIIKTKNVRPFPVFKGLGHAYGGKIVAQFLYNTYSKSTWMGLYSDLEVNLCLSSLKRRIKSFKEKGWPTVQERAALLKFMDLGLK